MINMYEGEEGYIVHVCEKCKKEFFYDDEAVYLNGFDEIIEIIESQYTYEETLCEECRK